MTEREKWVRNRVAEIIAAGSDTIPTATVDRDTAERQAEAEAEEKFGDATELETEPIAATSARTPEEQRAELEERVQSGEISLEDAQNELLSMQMANTVPVSLAPLTGGRSLTQAEIREAIDFYNENSVTGRINTVAELYQRADAGDLAAFTAVGQVLSGSTATAMRIFVGSDRLRMGQPKYVYVPAEEWTSALQTLGPQASGYLGKVVATAHRSGGGVPWQVLASATKMSGVESKQRPEQRPERKRSKGLFGTVMSAADEMFDTALAPSRQQRTGASVDQMVRQLDRQLSGQFSRYNDWTLALLSLEDPRMADAIYERGYATADEAMKVRQVLHAGSVDTEAMVNQGLIDPNKLLALTGDASSSQGRVQVNLPDPEQLNEGVRTLYRAWFREEPSEGELAMFRGDIEGAIHARAQEASARTAGNVFKGIVAGQEVVSSEAVDPEARLRQQARNDPRYKLLFGNRQQGQSEDQYVQQFEGSVRDLVGMQGPTDEAVRAGMLSGKTDTTRGATFAGQVSSDDRSSTFRERLAEAASVIARMT